MKETIAQTSSSEKLEDRLWADRWRKALNSKPVRDRCMQHGDGDQDNLRQKRLSSTR